MANRMWKSQKLWKQSGVGEAQLICAAGGSLVSETRDSQAQWRGLQLSSASLLCNFSQSQDWAFSWPAPRTGSCTPSEMKCGSQIRRRLKSWESTPDFERKGEESPATMLNKASSALLTMVEDWLRYLFLLGISEGKNIYHPLQHNKAVRKTGI